MIFIAEIGLNYNGNIDLAAEMIRQAKTCGADIVKFQLGWRDKKNEINFLDQKKIKFLQKVSKYNEIDLMFSIISENAFELISKFKFNKFKIASRTLKYDLNLAKKIVKKNKLTFISLGMWEKKKFPFVKNKNIKYLWCKSEYPSYEWNLKNFPKKFSNKKFDFDGYSDHTLGIEMCLIAISRGAKIIEKHFTLNKSNSSIRDHTLSATPEEFKMMVEIGRSISKKINLNI